MNVQLYDKNFKPYLSKDQISLAVSKVAQEINSLYADKNPVLIAVLNGAFMFCADLCRNLNCSPEVQFVKLSSYEGLQSTGIVKELIGLNIDLTNRHVIVIEDIVDTGGTVEILKEMLAEKNVASLAVATFLFKPAAFKGVELPGFIGMEIPNDFVVGYGLDYNGLGRELAELYVLNN